jgi:hypothetical protein
MDGQIGAVADHGHIDGLAALITGPRADRIAGEGGLNKSRERLGQQAQDENGAHGVRASHP